MDEQLTKMLRDTWSQGQGRVFVPGGGPGDPFGVGASCVRSNVSSNVIYGSSESSEVSKSQLGVLHVINVASEGIKVVSCCDEFR